MKNIVKTYWQKLMANQALKDKLNTVIFGSDTPTGKLFDVILMGCIVFSILLVFVESMQIPMRFKPWLVYAEYLFTFVFTAEYLLRLYCSPEPRKYAFSFFGIIDLLATLPFYITWLFGPARYFMVIRTFRLIRVFRVFKLFNFLNEGNMLLRSLILSARKIGVFALFVIIMVISLGTVMYMVEGQEPDTQFTSIPKSIYWAIVTLTTVGYGDVTPVTSLGQFVSSIVMLLGYTIIAVPTGIVSASMMQASNVTEEEVEEEEQENNRLLSNLKYEDEDAEGGQELNYCPFCGGKILYKDANYCPHCGHKL